MGDVICGGLVIGREYWDSPFCAGLQLLGSPRARRTCSKAQWTPIDSWRYESWVMPSLGYTAYWLYWLYPVTGLPLVILVPSFQTKTTDSLLLLYQPSNQPVIPTDGAHILCKLSKTPCVFVDLVF